MATAIEWTDETWNPIVGCSHAGYQPVDGGPKRVHPGCENCYAERTTARGLDPAHRAAHDRRPDGRVDVRWNGKVRFRPHYLEKPFIAWKARKDGTGRRIFVASISDLGHPGLPDEQRAAIYGAMLLSPWNTYQNLSKRPDVLARFKDAWNPTMCAYQFFEECPSLEADWSTFPCSWEEQRHIHEIVSVSDQPTADALIPLLLSVPAAVRGVSYEPATGPVDFERWLSPSGTGAVLGQCVDIDLMSWHHDGEVCRKCGFGMSHLNWIIIGGESGRGARPFDLQWARDALRQGKEAGVPVFVKQMGKRPVETATGYEGTRWEGGTIEWNFIDPKGGASEEWPEDLRVREFPDSFGGLR